MDPRFNNSSGGVEPPGQAEHNPGVSLSLFLKNT